MKARDMRRAGAEQCVKLCHVCHQRCGPFALSISSSIEESIPKRALACTLDHSCSELQDVETHTQTSMYTVKAPRARVPARIAMLSQYVAVVQVCSGVWQPANVVPLMLQSWAMLCKCGLCGASRARTMGDP